VIRESLRWRSRWLAYLLGHLLTVALSLILIWYGAMVVLLAAKISPHTVNAISGYHGLYKDIAGLRRANFTTLVRVIAGLAGFLAFCVFLWLALQRLSVPNAGRHRLTLGEDDRGATTVEPRAIERLAEIAAQSHRDVSHATGHLGDQQISVDIDVCRADTAAQVLRAVATSIADALDSHELPALTVNVTLTGYEPTTRRQLA
jgi:hypothetical protein